MFIESQILYNLTLAQDIRQLGFDVYCPNENAEINDKTRADITGQKIYEHDIDEILTSNILLCQVADCPGTMWEAGYMDCLSKNVDSSRYLGVIGLCTDIRLQTAPDLRKPSYDNQTMYLNQFMVGGLKMSLGVCTNRPALFSELGKLKAEFKLD
ncbi:hypothetical protein HFO13_12815 [Rhizobium leguminosarum]|nr:hypothetical protein [Rhizobium leguminosarum]